MTCDMSQRFLYPRISDIVDKQIEREMRQIPLEKLIKSAERGEKVHQYCTKYLTGQSIWLMDIEPEYVPYVNSFIEWADKNIISTLHYNERLYDDQKKFSGEFDLICQLKNKEIALLDIKTACTYSKAWPVKMAAYKHLCHINNYQVDSVYNIHLKKVKPPAYEKLDEEKILISEAVIKTILIPIENMEFSWGIFMSALTCYDYFDRKEKKSKIKERNSSCLS